MAEQKPTAPDGDAAGVEPEEESGAGYGNHAPTDPAEEPSEPDKDGALILTAHHRWCSTREERWSEPIRNTAVQRR